MKHFLQLFILIGLLPMGVLAQRSDRRAPSDLPLPLCSTADLTEAQHRELTKQASQALAAKRASNAAFTSITYVPIRPHILRRNDGTGGMSMATLNQVIAVTNSYYLKNGLGIQFYFCGTTPDYIDNDAQYNSFSDETAITQGHDVPNALNQYYVNWFASGAGGYAYYPADNLVTTRSFILNESPQDEEDMGNRLIPHELGHNFNLVHTFGQQVGNGTLGSGTTLELVTRGAGANCTTEGDYICDTPADPYNMPGANLLYVDNCPQYDPASTARDANGLPYSPSVTNIMSYYFPCSHDFSSGQYDRIQAGLALRQSHTAYTLDCPPTAVSAPGNLVASANTGNVILTWQDNASNEMGYFIERSLSPTSGFSPIGGVGPNTTTFSDLKTAGATLYYYRIRPSNATTSGVSQTISVRSPSCHPTYTRGCTEGDGLSSFSLNNVALSQNSGCSSDGYSVFDVTPGTVVAGQTYPISGRLLVSNLYAQGITIWADLNRNGIFETSQGERLYQTPYPILSSFSGNLTLPANLATGPLTIRVVAVYNTLPNDPCGAYFYGETEDYVITVAKNADLAISLITNKLTSAINQPISYSLTLRNDGPDNATGVSWQNRLPANLSFVSGDASIVNSGTAIGANNLSLPSGTSTTFTYQLQPGQSGTYINAAQIISSNALDPDSQPDSGTEDGQDDAVMVTIRTASAGVALFSSPNPDQTPLPLVISNQPTPDPAKADLSLYMAASQHTLRLGQPVTCTLTISNTGGLTATNIVVRDTLRGLTLTSSPSGIHVVSTNNDYTIIEGTVASLSNDMATQLIFTATPIVSGRVLNVAQIWSCDTADADSAPGLLTPVANNVNGEDDVVEIDFRVSLP